ncbi:MAG: glycosyltransferase family 2 protein [Chloroflexi bacterium]|nr:glycosyltransferase family 2 protein [Chloroflexota bacterium]
MTIQLSIIVRVVAGREFLRRCLDHLARQTAGRPFEIIVPYDARVAGIEQIKNDYPEIIFVATPALSREDRLTPGIAHEVYDVRTAAGLRAARGDLIAILEDFGIAPPDWCDQILRAHQLPHGVIGGSLEHVGRGLLNWAVFFLDLGRYQLPLREGVAEYLTDNNVSYKRPALETVKHVWSERYNEATVHWALARNGVVLWRRPQMVMHQDRGQLKLITCLTERFFWGRIFGRKRAAECSRARRVIYILASPLIPAIVLARLTGKIMRGARHRAQFIIAFPLTVALASCWTLGELVGYLQGAET